MPVWWNKPPGAAEVVSVLILIAKRIVFTSFRFFSPLVYRYLSAHCFDVAVEFYGLTRCFLARLCRVTLVISVMNRK